MISGKTLFAAVCLLGVTTPAYAVTINTTFTTGPSAAPVPVFQSFTTGNGNGATYTSTTIVTPTFTATESKSLNSVVNTYQGDVSGQAVGPVPAYGSFLSILQGSYSIAFGPGVQALSFVFGGLDSYNSVTLNFANAGAVSLFGQETSTGLAGTGAGPTNSGTTGRVTYDFGGTDILNSVTFATSQAAFEIDEVAAAVPEPATWAIMLLGFGMIGSALRRRRVTAKVRYNFA